MGNRTHRYYPFYIIHRLNTTIQIKKTTKERLAKYGNVSSTYDSALNDLMNRCDSAEVEKNE